MPAQPLTTEQLEDAARLKKLFLSWQQQQRDASAPVSQEAAAERLGFNQSALSQYLNGKIPLNVGAATKFSELLGRSVAEFSPRLHDQLKEYASSVMPEESAASDAAPLPPGARRVVADDADEMVEIRKVRLKLRAGVSRFEAEPIDGDGDPLKVSRAELERQGLNPDKLIGIEVRGMSMEPLMFEGDTVVIDPTDKKLVSRELYALNFDGDCCVKQMLHKAGAWYLHSINSDHKPVRAESGQCDVIGRVVYQPGRPLKGRL
ncbi:XRE family transcriptional regulator [Massilia oculi]|uniref:XRE family transcriptional regulator n=1 Tax=Massilia hydrophila TaxID=3044279 RepID=A0ABS7YED9_9BURK|nr:XRE family transcriptional regulator [Massilia oculi]MCA1857427.1 XRE family transcriptional regulator [Massilia oculi]